MGGDVVGHIVVISIDPGPNLDSIAHRFKMDSVNMAMLLHDFPIIWVTM